MVRGAQGSRTSLVGMGCAVVLAGLLAGYTVGRLSILYATRARMADYSEQLMEHDEEIAAEIDTILIRANNSPAPACSDADIVLLRQLTFAARFIKDAGRLDGSVLRCTATAGVLKEPSELSGPDFTVPHGTSIYRSRPLSILGGASAEIVTLGRSEVVVSPDIFSEFSQRPFHYYYGVTDRSRGVLHSRILGAISLPPNLLNAHSPMQVGDELYAARCSRSYAVCAVTHASLAEIWHSNRALMATYVLTGTIAGLVCAVALAMAGHKRRSQTNQLKRAILLGKLSVAYQPIVELESHRIVGAEALARWTDEDGESIRPETIVALAEAEGFVSEITRFVLTRSLDELGTILEENPAFQLSINLAPSDMADPRLLLLLDEKLAERQIAPRNLTFELTERATSDR
jgi:sensor c-di-GMP phosphodiesterase-like protein